MGGRTPVFGYTPPFEPWLVWQSSGEPELPPEGLSDGRGGQFVFFGNYRSHALWGVPKSFHDFQLALLGSIPNTAGSSAAGTSPAPTKQVVDTGQLLLKAVVTQESFEKADEDLTIRFTILNTTQRLLDAVKLSSTRFKLKDEACVPASLAPNGSANCIALTRTTPDDVTRKSVEDLTTVYGTDPAGTVLSSAVNIRIPLKGTGTARVTTRTQQPAAAVIVTPQPQRRFETIYPTFVPGKSSGPQAPTLTPPAQ